MHTVYLSEALGINERKETVRKLCKCIKESDLEFDSIAFTGMSGALIAPLVCEKLGKNLIMVRKESDKNHSDMLIEAEKVGEKYIIIDDLVFSGETLCHIINVMKNSVLFGDMLPVAVFTYRVKDSDRICDSYTRLSIERKTGCVLRYQNCNSKKVY